MIDLDDQSALERHDSEGVLGVLEGFAEQVRSGWDIGAAVGSLPSPEGVEHIVVLGMGGSASAGDIVEAVIEPRLPFPYRVVKGYPPLPEWVGRNTLVVAISYSGNTEETLEAFTDAHERGARLVAISSGGTLAEAAEGSGATHVAVPGGLQPRAALGYLAMSLLAVLSAVGLIPDPSQDVTEAVDDLEELAKRCYREIPRVENPAKDVAARLKGRVPILYGGSVVTGAVARRFKCDLNEYAKVPAFFNVLPEMNHNEIVGWEGMSDLTQDRFAVVFLRDPEEHPRVALRFDLTRAIIEDRAAEVIELHTGVGSALARLLRIVFITQMAAIYLGLSYGSDPGPVPVLERIKRQLAERTGAST